MQQPRRPINNKIANLRKGKMFKSKKPEKSDLLQSSTSSYMFNPAPVYSEQLETKKVDPSKLLQKRRVKERQKLEKRAELLEYMSSEDDVDLQPTKRVQGQGQQEDDYGALEHFDQDILGYFQVKGPKIITQAEKVQEATFSEGTLVLGCVAEIGANGKYLIVNFTRNKKGFLSVDHLRNLDKVNAGHFQLGEYILCKVTQNHDSTGHKIQLNSLPSVINAGRRLGDVVANTLINGIPVSEDEFGYQVSFFEDQREAAYKGFIKNGQNLRLGRTYLFEVESTDIKQRLVVCKLPDPTTVQQTDQINKRIQKGLTEPRWIFIPGTQWECQLVKEVKGGVIVKTERFGVVGYIFDDYVHMLRKRTKFVARLISFDYHLRNVQFSVAPQHLALERHSFGEFKIGRVYNAIKVVKALFGGSYQVYPVQLEEVDVNDDSNKGKKKAKFIEKNEAQIIETGPLSFVHSSQLWITEVADEELYTNKISYSNMSSGKLVQRPCRIKEFNYFDHSAVITMKPSLINKTHLTIHDLEAGKMVNGVIKSVLKDNNNKLVIVLSPAVQAIIQDYHQYDNPGQKGVHKFQVGAKIKARILKVDLHKKSVLLTIKPIFMQRQFKVVSALDQITFSDQIYGFIQRKLDNGVLVSFFQGVQGFLSLKELELSSTTLDDLTLGQTIKVYVKYVNAKESKLQLSLKQQDTPQENDIVVQFREQKAEITKSVQALQVPTFPDSKYINQVLTFHVRKTPQIDPNLIVLELSSSKTKKPTSSITEAFVLLKEQATHTSDSTIQSELLLNLKTMKQPIQALVIPSHSGVALVSLKFSTCPPQTLQVGQKVWGYVIELQSRYALIVLPQLNSAPTGILYLDQQKSIQPITFMQSLYVRIKKLVEKDGIQKIHLDALDKSEFYDRSVAVSHFEAEKILHNHMKLNQEDIELFETLKIGNVLNVKISMVKQYGVVTTIAGKATGFIMNQNLLGGREYTPKLDVMVQVLDIDFTKKIVDLREVSQDQSQLNIPNNNQLQMSQKQLPEQDVAASILLVKECYCVVKVKQTNIIGYLWHNKSIYVQDQSQEFGRLMKNLQIINQVDLKKSHQQQNDLSKILKQNYVPIFIQQEDQKDQTEKVDTHDQYWKGQSVKTTIVSKKAAYLYTRLPNEKQGRIHKSQFQIVTDDTKYFGYNSDEFDSQQKNQTLDCTVIRVRQKEGSKSRFTELSTLDKSTRQITGDPIKDLGKEVFGVVTLIRQSTPVVLQIEVLGGHQLPLNGWECGLVPCDQGEKLNTLNKLIKMGDLIKLRLQGDYNKRTSGLVMFEGKEPTPIQVELYSVQIFRVVSHHISHIRVQLAHNNYASIDITELSDQWLPNILDKFPVGYWGSCRLLAQDEKSGYLASCRADYLRESTWDKSLHPIKSSQLSFQKEIKQGVFDQRFNLYKNAGLSLEPGTLVLGYVTALTDHGVFVKFGWKPDMVLLVQPQEISDSIENSIAKHIPVLCLITKQQEGKWRGTLRYSLISQKTLPQPKTGDVVEGVVTQIKNNRAMLKLHGYTILAELDKKNAEGADTDEGWWTEKLVKTGQTLKAVVISIKELKGGDKVAKLSNLADLLEEKVQLQKKQKSTTKENTNAMEVYNSLKELSLEYLETQQKSTQIIQEEKQSESEDQEEIADEQSEDENDENNDIEEEQVDQPVDESVEEEELDEATLRSRAEFEKQILSNPNSSELWIKYASYGMESEGIESARGVMERALRVINFVNENDRLNLWTSYLNLELNFGQEEKLISTFKKGCNSCNPKHLHLKLIDIYRKADKYDLMVELAKSMVNKHKQSGKCWKELLLCLMEWHENSQVKKKDLAAYSLKDNIARGLQCLKAHKHPQLLAHYGRLQFQMNQVEQGKTSFDALLVKYPKRTDIFSQYVDLSSKYCTKDVTRQLFQRSLQNRLNPHKTKFIFKKWLEFEAQYGTPQQVQLVQQKAQEWIQNYKQGHADREIEEESEEEKE